MERQSGTELKTYELFILKFQASLTSETVVTGGIGGCRGHTA